MIDPSQERPPKDDGHEEGLSRGEWALVALAVVIAGGGLAFWYLRRDAPTPPIEVVNAAAPVTPAASATGGPAPASAPATVGADTQARLDAVSAHPTYRAWLAAGDVLNRWALVTDNLAEGTSPRKPLAALTPVGAFTVAQRGADTVIAPESYRRYDAVGDAVASVDPAAFAAAYQALHPVLEAAWRVLGDPHGALDATAARALNRLAAAPLAEGEVRVVPAGPVNYAYVDPTLEALGPVEKHVLRMGPRNGKIVREKAAALRQALGLPAAAPPAGGR
jgi:hypothetical protein